MSLRSEEEEDSDHILKNWEIKNIGLQATAKIKSSETPLFTMMRLSQAGISCYLHAICMYFHIMPIQSLKHVAFKYIKYN